MADMIPDQGSTATPKKRRTPRRYLGLQPKTRRPPLDPSRRYTLQEAALACTCSISTILRARNSGNLVGLRVGAKNIFSGEALIAWIDAGGRTVTGSNEGAAA